MPKPRDPETASPLAKFLIGFLAGLCACYVPRLGRAIVLAGGPDDDLMKLVFGWKFFALALVLSSLIGFAILVFEYKSSRVPRETFIAALGIPALIAGTINASYSASQQKDLSQEYAMLLRTYTQGAGIPVDSGHSAQEKPVPVSPEPEPEKKGVWIFDLIPSAQAQDKFADGTGQLKGYFGPLSVQPYFDYMVVFDRASTKEDALEKLRRAKVKLPLAKAFAAGTGYVVALDPQPASAAVPAAIKIKELGFDVSLLPTTKENK